MKKIYITLFLFLSCSAFQQLSAQRRVLPTPKVFLKPIDYFDISTQDELDVFIESTVTQGRPKPWFVISDRANNPVYDENGNSTGRKIGFRETFYVVDEKSGFIKIVDSESASLDRLRILNEVSPIGWVKKENMLLWRNGLLDERTGIHKKVLLLNRADDIANVIANPNRELVKRFEGPELTAAKEGNVLVYEYFYVLKRDLATDRVLIARESELDNFAIKRKGAILGWINNGRCARWDNRICLEPNDAEAAFQERANNDAAKIRAFEKLQDVTTFVEGTGTINNVFFDTDPVTLPPERITDRRWEGGILRFPALSNFTGISRDDRYIYFRSGVIGEILTRGGGSIPPDKYAAIQKILRELEYKSTHVNIYFVVEATDSLKQYRTKIADVVGSFSKNKKLEGLHVNYGALLYRDLNNTYPVVEKMALTSDARKVKTFIENSHFENNQDQDAWTAFYYGIDQALRFGGFDEKATNIIIQIGKSGDLRASQDRRDDIERRRTNQFDDVTHSVKVTTKKVPVGKLFYDKDKVAQITRKLVEIDAHLHVIQVGNDPLRPSRAFSLASQSLILENAKSSYNSFQNNAEVNQDNIVSNLSLQRNLTPDMEDVIDLNLQKIWLEEGRTAGAIMRPARGSHMGSTDFKKAIELEVFASIDFARVVYDKLYNTYFGGASARNWQVSKDLPEGVSPGAFTAAVMPVLDRFLKEAGVTQEELEASLREDKFQLFTEVYVPLWHKNTQHPAYKFVLFMPRLELSDYKETFEQRGLFDESTNMKERRQMLFNVYKQLVVNLTGDRDLKDEDGNDINRNKMIGMLHGLGEMDIEFDLPYNVNIPDILDERKVSEETVKKLISRFEEVYLFLENEVYNNEEYPFMYIPEGGKTKYYWIRLEDAF